MEAQRQRSEEVEPIKIRVRQVFHGNGESTHARTVFCPARDRSVSVRACDVCGHGQGQYERPGSETIFCDHGGARDAALRQLLREPVATRDRTPVRDVMTAHVLCVRSDVSLEALSSLLLERNITAVPVVDDRGSPIGVVSKTDLLQHRYDNGETEVVDTALDAGFHESTFAAATVADIMVPVPITFFEDAIVSQVAAVMAYERLHSLPIVGNDGTVVGIVSSLDVVGWYAQREGYVLGARR